MRETIFSKVDQKTPAILKVNSPRTTLRNQDWDRHQPRGTPTKTQDHSIIDIWKVGCAIEGRVTTKGDGRHYQRNDKQVFLSNFDVIDNTGCVTVLAVNNEDDSMFEKITVGRAHRISNYKVAPIKKAFGTHKRGFQLELLEVKDLDYLDQLQQSLNYRLSNFQSSNLFPDYTDNINRWCEPTRNTIVTR